MHPLIKWPGGKTRELEKIEKYIPQYDRYIEPFFGGGALFFSLKPKKAAINDISSSLVEFYELIKRQDQQLYGLLMCYSNSFVNLIKVCEENYSDIFRLYDTYARNLDLVETGQQLSSLLESLSERINSGFGGSLVLDSAAFYASLRKNVLDKIHRTYKNNLKKPFSAEDMESNLLTGFTSGYYMYFRDIYNAINSRRIAPPSVQYKVANFYFIREYCYGSMFRYNARGEFNIPYGGISYNKKNLRSKIDSMFCEETHDLFSETDINCSDFEPFLESLSLGKRDFVFLDPPYDSDFSDYDGKAFTRSDHERLANFLKRTSAQFILVIKNTPFIRSLYEEDFNTLSFDKQYTYNVRSRNDRDTEHLIITNLPV